MLPPSSVFWVVTECSVMVDTNVSEVHAASSSVLWVVTLYSVVGYKPFRGQCCLHLQCEVRGAG